MHKKILTVVGIAFLFLGTCITPSVAVDNVKKSSIPISKGNTLYVGGIGPDNYTNIQDAINDAFDGYTVFVFNGTYFEDIIVNKSIKLIGESREKTFIRGNGGEDAVINITADWVCFSEFTISRGDYSGIKICSDHSSITRNNLLDYLEGSTINRNNLLDVHISGIEICSNFNIVKNNSISHYELNGIYLSNSTHDNIIERNNISSYNNQCISVYGITLDSSNNNNIIGNIISNYFFGIHLKFSRYNSILNNNISLNYGDGIAVISSNFNSINNNKFENNEHDLGLLKSNNNNLSCNTFAETHCHRSIEIRNSNHNYIYKNIILNGGIYGIEIIFNSFFNTITSNNITKGWEGIRIWINSCYNSIINNTISNNKYGIYIENLSNNNSIYHNNFINNSQNAYDECNNHWDDGYPSGGNFWNDYNGTDADGDGIGDMPYFIPGGFNEDRYPLMDSWNFKRPVANFSYNVEESPVMFDGSSSYDPDGEIVSYDWDFGDGRTGTGNITYHTYCVVGTYDVALKVTDKDGIIGVVTKSVKVIKANIPPTVEIDGPNRGKPGVEYEYVFNVIDPEPDDFYIWVDWGDGNSTGFIGPFIGGVPVRLGHIWNETGKYMIRVIVKDLCGEESEWTHFKVVIPRTRTLSHPLFEWLLKYFPMLERLLDWTYIKSFYLSFTFTDKIYLSVSL